MSRYLELRTEIHTKQAALDEVWKQAGDGLDMGNVLVLEGDSKSKTEQMMTMTRELDGLWDEWKPYKDIEDAKGLHEQRSKYLLTPDGRMVFPDGHPEDGSLTDEQRTQSKGRRKSLGELYVESPAFKEFSRAEGRGPAVELDISLREIQALKAVFRTGAGWAIEDLRLDRVILDQQRPAPDVTQFIPQTQTGQANVLFMEETTFTNLAAEVAESTATTDADLYAESSLALTEQTSPVRKIGHFLPVTDEQFEEGQRGHRDGQHQGLQ